MAVKISVLIPVYNVEHYLRQCLESVRAQSFGDFEALCINDGSTDSSRSIIAEFAAADSRFKLIDKPNGGYGSAMNAGLEAATGDTIGIVESDDYAEPQMLARLYAMAAEHDLDIARCNYYRLAEGQRTKEDLHYVPAGRVLRPLDAPAVFYQAPAIWANLYRRQMLEQHRIRFLETPGAAYQDTSFAFKAYAVCRRFMFLDEPLLNYRLDNPNSSVSSQGKVFAVCAEQAEILAFAKRDAAIYAALKAHLPVIRYACYAWNFRRIDRQFRLAFLRQWGREIRADYRDGRGGSPALTQKRRRRSRIIACFPRYYQNRERSL